MGNFYTSIALRDVTQSQVQQVLRKLHRRAFIAPTRKRITVVYDAGREGQDTKTLCELALTLSRKLDCAAWGVLNHDDDVLWYVLCSTGEYVDSYNSSPGYFDEDAGPESAPQGGDAKVLASLFGAARCVRRVAALLRKPDSDDDRGYTFAQDRHCDLAKALGVPFPLVSVGYNYIADGQLPDGLRIEDLVAVPPKVVRRRVDKPITPLPRAAAGPTLRKRGKWWYGDSQADIRTELVRYGRLNEYIPTKFANAKCVCGSKRFRLLLDDTEGAAVRICAKCRKKHPIGDSEEFLDGAELDKRDCICGKNVFEITVGVSLYDDCKDVRWLYVGCRCPACGLTGCYGDWKNEFNDYRKLLARV